MRAANDLLQRVRDSGGTVQPQGDILKLRAPQPLSADLLDELRQHKMELIAFMQQLVPLDAKGLPFRPCVCGCRSFWKPAGSDWHCQDCTPYSGILHLGDMTCTLPITGWPVLSDGHNQIAVGTTTNSISVRRQEWKKS